MKTERKFNFYANYRKDFLAAIVLRLLQLSELFHQPLGSDCCVNFRNNGKLRLAAVARRYCAARKRERVKGLRLER